MVREELPRSAAQRDGPRHPQVEEALRRLGAADGSGLRLTERALGRAVGLAGPHLGRLLHKQTGRRFRDWRRAFRLRQAVKLLAASPEHVRQIAYRIGYQDASHFAHDFHGVLGFSPRAFRNAVRASADPRAGSVDSSQLS